MNGPMRRLDLAGAVNFRDLGGYQTKDGRMLRWRHLYRSSHLGSLTETDQQLLTGLGLATICDFRGVAESGLKPSVVGNIAVQPLSIEPSILPKFRALMAAGQSLNGAVAAGLMQDSYRAYVRTHADRFGALFDHVLAAKGPLVFHCSAGKDRTGFAAALILTALGVSRETIVEDYLLTARYWRHEGGSSDLPEDVVAVLNGVHADYLTAAFTAIDEDYGSMNNFLSQRLRVGPAERLRLAATYLE